ncbi:hypothetical protein N0V82_009260 [Gnomoniopsis sp. IMI 355080]|nr:hypothetical protein N0V82_009260 [Gnomoniopsis sp. IMI 355080]
MAPPASKRSSFARFLSGERHSSNSTPPRFLAFRSSKAFIGSTVCIAIFTDILLYGIIVPVLPFALTDRVGIPSANIQTWNAILLACYTIALFIGSPLVGIYADHTSSRRWPLLIGLFALAASTLLLCLGTTIALLVVGRLLQGFSAAIVWSVGLALLADTFGDKIGMAMGYSAISMSLGLLISPAIGGAVFDREGYYAVYYVAFGCIVLDIFLRLILIEKKIAQQWVVEEDDQSRTRTNDAIQDGEGNSEIASNEKRVDEPARHSTATTASPLATAGTRGLLARYPMLRLFKSRRILAANFGIIIQAAVMFAWDTVLPLFVKETFHWSSTDAGLMFFTLFIPGFISPLVGYLSDRYGARWPSLAGFVASIPLLVCLRFVSQNTLSQKVLLGVILSLVGVTLSFANTPLMAEITYAIEAEEAETPGVFGTKGVYGLGYGLFCTSFALGGSIGSLMSGYVMAARGWGTLTWALAVWMAGGAVVIGLFAGARSVPVSKKDEGSATETSQGGQGDMKEASTAPSEGTLDEDVSTIV